MVGTCEKSFSTSWKLSSASGGRRVVVDDGGFWSKILDVGARAGEVRAGWKGFVAVLYRSFLRILGGITLVAINRSKMIYMI